MLTTSIITMKKILYIYHASNIGGGTYCLLNILKELDRSIMIPIVLLKGYGPLVDEIHKLGINVAFFPHMSQIPYNKSIFKRRVLTNYLKLGKYKNEFKHVVSELNVDVVYINTMVLAPYLKTCKELGLKTIIHIREHWPKTQHKIQLKNLQKCISKYADEIIAINSYSASLIPDRKVTIVYDWIDFSNRYEYRPFDRIFREDTSKLKVYLYIGGSQLIKGFYEVIKAFTSHIKGNDCRLLVLGLEQNNLSKGLKGIIRRLLYCIGYDEKRRKAYEMIERDSRIVVIPSTYMMKHIFQQAYCNLSYYTIPHANLALAESIILGTISIAARNEESLEYSESGSLAILFEPNDYSSFLAAIDGLNSNYSTLKYKLTHSDTIKNQFDKNSNLKKLTEIYSNILSKVSADRQRHG